MPSLAEYRKKIKGIKSTRQITKAMKMVSGARFARAQRLSVEARKYCTEVERLALSVAAGKDFERETARFFASGSAKGGAGLLVVTGDKGLCGGFNSNVIRESERFLASCGTKAITFLLAGNKANEFYRRRSIPVVHAYTNMFAHLDFAHAETISRDIITAYVKSDLSEVNVIYNKFRSVIKQEVVTERILPIPLPAAPTTGIRVDYLLEPGREELLPMLIPAYVRARVYQILRESSVAELAARMTAMDNATRNAGSLIDSITLEMNKLRQSTITRELIEIVGTNEVVK